MGLLDKIWGGNGKNGKQAVDFNQAKWEIPVVPDGTMHPPRDVVQQNYIVPAMSYDKFAGVVDRVRETMTKNELFGAVRGTYDSASQKRTLYVRMGVDSIAARAQAEAALKTIENYLN